MATTRCKYDIENDTGKLPFCKIAQGECLRPIETCQLRIRQLRLDKETDSISLYDQAEIKLDVFWGNGKENMFLLSDKPHKFKNGYWNEFLFVEFIDRRGRCRIIKSGMSYYNGEIAFTNPPPKNIRINVVYLREVILDS